jgi:hypothetical protein
LRRLLGAPSRRGYWVERLRAFVVGYPPRVRPWHPRWPDYRLVLRRLSPVFADPARPLLHVADAPTLFSVMLGDDGRDVVRLQTTPLLQGGPPGEAVAGRFDLCLIELEQGDADKTGELTRKLVPLMKRGGRLLIVIGGQQPMADAHRFGTDLGETLRREASPARLEDVRCVPASKLRSWCYQTFAHMGAAAHQRPWLGLPALGLFAVPLALFTLVLNMVAALRTGAKSRRGMVSSVHIVVRIAGGE